MQILELAPGMTLGWCTLEGQSAHQAGRALLSELYRRRTGNPLPPIGLGPWGKPYLEGDSLHFSIAHTDQHAFCLLAPWEVGMDAEEEDRPIRLALAEKILSPEEKRRFALSPDPRQALLRLWVLKEAAAKLSGQGLRGYPNHTSFAPEDPRIRRIGSCLVAIFTEGEH